MTPCPSRMRRSPRARRRAGPRTSGAAGATLRAAPCDFDDVDLPAGSGGRTDSRRSCCPPRCALRLPQQPAGLAGLQQDGFLAAVQAARGAMGRHRVGVLLGTSTSGILQTELAYRRATPAGALPPDFRYANTHSTRPRWPRFVRRGPGRHRPAWVVSTACSSSAKVFATPRAPDGGWLVDAAVVGGVDTLCLTTLYGFHSLQLFAADLCRPWDAQRSGISLGEGAASRCWSAMPADPPVRAAAGRRREQRRPPHERAASGGRWAPLAMRQALAPPACARRDRLHQPARHRHAQQRRRRRPGGAAVFGRDVPCSSTKGATGHTLGAAGGVEAVISAAGAAPRPDARRPQRARARSRLLGIHYLQANRMQPLRHVLSQFLRLRRHQRQPGSGAA